MTRFTHLLGAIAAGFTLPAATASSPAPYGLPWGGEGRASARVFELHFSDVGKAEELARALEAGIDGAAAAYATS